MTATAPGRLPLWRNVRVLRMVVQAAALAAAALAVLWLVGNVRANARDTGIPLTLDYLDQPSNISIPGSAYRPTQSMLDALGVGVGNTVRVAVLGVVLSTVLGTVLGISLLSTNWLLARAARVYVEIVRNVPVLVIVVFSYLAVFLRFPRLEDSTTVAGLVVANVRGVSVPWLRTERFGAVLAVLVVAVVAGAATSRGRTRQRDRTGARTWPVTSGLAVAGVVVAAGLLALGTPVRVTTPELVGRRIEGGITMLPEYAALLAALVAYTSSHIAEIIRGSIQAVPKGQFEAATALGLSGGQRMRLVVLPQAMRIAVPSLGNQYLNLTKNSSLAVAVSYFEATKVTQVLNANGAPAVPSFVLLLLIYLVLSLTLSALVNVANRRLALVER